MNFRFPQLLILLSILLMASHLRAFAKPVAVGAELISNNASLISVEDNATPITVDANENTTVTLFFPSTISKVIAPAANFSFTHEPNGNMATLKAKKGNPSNLTVITEEGDIYSFALRYNETIQNFTYVISPEQAMGRRGGAVTRRTPVGEKIPDSPEPSPIDSEDAIIDSEDATTRSFQAVDNGDANFNDAETNTAEGQYAEGQNAEIPNEDSEEFASELFEDNFVEKGSFYDMDCEGYYQVFSENSMLQRSITKKNMRTNGGVDLRVNHVAVDHDELYFTMQFRNVSKSDYKIGDVRFYIQTLGNEEMPMAPLHIHNLRELVKQSGVNKFVYIFKNFQLGADQKVYVVMDEKDGHRNIVLPLNLADWLEDLE